MILVLFAQESYKELAGLQNLGAKNSIQEALVVSLSLAELSSRGLLDLDGGQGRNNNLRVHA